MRNSLSTLPIGFIDKYLNNQNAAVRGVLGAFLSVKFTSSNTLSKSNEESTDLVNIDKPKLL